MIAIAEAISDALDKVMVKITKFSGDMTKFIKENKNPIPFSLHYELENKFQDLIITFKKISFDFVKGKNILEGDEINYLKNNYENIYNVLKSKSKNFKNENILVDVLIKSVDILRSISSWLDTVSHYPSDKGREKRIIKKNKRLLKNLQKVPRLHFADLKIICIANEYAKKLKGKICFITRDKGISDNKKILEGKFKYILIKKIGYYV